MGLFTMPIVPEDSRVESPDALAEGLSSPEAAATAPALRVFKRVDTDPVPPSSNTGAQNTETKETSSLPVEPCFTASVDWLSFTWPITVTLQDALARLDGLEPFDWTPTERGGNGYKQGLVSGHLKVFHDGNPDMGVFVQMTGKACQQFANCQYWTSEEGWRGFIGDILSAGCNVTRLDLAYDDVGERVLYMKEVRAAIDEGRVVSKWKEADPSGKRSLCEKAEIKGDMVHFGSILSEVSGVIYDKAKERLMPGAHWVRCELRTKRDKAMAMASAFVTEGFKAGVAVLRSYLDFKDRSETDSNRSRWATCDWWEKFCSGVEKGTLKVENVARTVDKVRAWLVKQVAPSLALLFEADGGSTEQLSVVLDVLSKDGLSDSDPGGLLSLLADGRKRLRQVHENMLREFRGCRSVEASDGRRLFEWPDGMWRYGAPPMGAFAGGSS